MKMLRAVSLTAGYGSVTVLRNVSIHIEAGEIVTIIGANGAGKTTLLKTLAGIIKPVSGTVTYSKEEITGSAPELLAGKGLVLVPEGRHLFNDMTVLENLQMGTEVHRGKKRQDTQSRIDSVFHLFPRLKERQNQAAGTLSGGEQQMAALGRALMADPKLIMLDEPSMGLAPLLVRDIMKAVDAMRREGKTVLLIEQNAKAALRIADRGYVLETGMVVMEGTPSELLNDADTRRAYLGKEYRSIDDTKEDLDGSEYNVQ
ncbi:MAG: ABC transporter ATP-binding protein [Spirochaetia bacterium]